jgi:hypothetical protein
MRMGENVRRFKSDFENWDGEQSNARLKAFENASTVSYSQLNAISVTETSHFTNCSAASDNLLNRMYSLTEYPVTALKKLEKEEGA